METQPCLRAQSFSWNLIFHNATYSFANSPELFASTCATLFARMVDTVPRGVQLTEIIKPLPVKPDSVQLVLNGGALQLSGEVRVRIAFRLSPARSSNLVAQFWNTTADPNRVVSLLWDDHVGGTHTVAMKASGTASAVAGRYTSVWYAFNSTVDPMAGITSMRFLVDGTLEDQGGVGFAVQDGIFFTKTSCITSQSPRTARFDVAVRGVPDVRRNY
jgi:hypothetical protein